MVSVFWVDLSAAVFACLELLEMQLGCGSSTDGLFSEDAGSVVIVDQTTGQCPSRRRVLPAPRSLVWWRGGEEALCDRRIVRERARYARQC